MPAIAFLSYASAQRETAKHIARTLAKFDIQCFLAHETLEVSEQWRLRLLEVLKACDLFVPLLSKDFIGSVWCLQECAIAAMREDLAIAPLSLDGTTPPGFLAHLQHAAVASNKINVLALAPAFLHNTKARPRGIELLLAAVAQCRTHAEVSDACAVLASMLGALSDEQIKRLVRNVLDNPWAAHSPVCNERILGALVHDYKHRLGRRLATTVRKHLRANAGGA